MKKRIIPKNKIAEMRAGQLIWNALAWKFGHDNLVVSDKLFFIENDKLKEIIRDFIKYYEKH